jgi:hypothetical protein
MKKYFIFWAPLVFSIVFVYVLKPGYVWKETTNEEGKKVLTFNSKAFVTATCILYAAVLGLHYGHIFLTPSKH